MDFRSSRRHINRSNRPNTVRLNFNEPSIALDPRITFTRSTVALRNDSAGTLTSTAIDVPRSNAFGDYDPSTLDPRGWLIEAGATNIILRSQEFDNASWPKDEATVTSNAGVAPDGTTTADKLIDTTAASTFHYTAQFFTGTAQTYAQSVYAKAAELSWIELRLWNGASNVAQAYFDLGNGAIGTVTSGTATIESVGNGWYRCTVAGALASTSGSCGHYILLATGNNGAIFTGNGSQGVLIWGAQLELGPFATSYIATTTAAVARGSDNGTITNLASIGFSATQGFIYAEFMLAGVGSANVPRVFSFNDGTANNMIEVIIRDDLTDGLVFFVNSGGVSQAAIAGPNIAANTLYKVAVSWAANSFRLAVNGTGYTEDTSGSVPTVDRLAFGKLVSTSYLNGWIPKLQYGPQLLTTAQLQAMTA